MIEKWTPAYRRYQWRTGIAMALYVGTLFAGAALTRHSDSAPLLYAAAIVPAICVGAVIVALGRYVAEERDEYQRLQVILRILWGTGAMLVITTLWGFLETVGGTPHVPFFWATVIWFFCFGAASIVTRCGRA